MPNNTQKIVNARLYTTLWKLRDSCAQFEAQLQISRHETLWFGRLQARINKETAFNTVVKPVQLISNPVSTGSR
jgi:hypothetical protein